MTRGHYYGWVGGQQLTGVSCRDDGDDAKTASGLRPLSALPLPRCLGCCSRCAGSLLKLLQSSYNLILPSFLVTIFELLF